MNKTLIYLLIALIGICAINTCNHSKKDKILNTYKQEIESLKISDKKYQEVTKTYQKTADSLSLALNTTNSDLKAEKIKLAATKLKLKVALEGNWTNISLEEKSHDCDTLRDIARNYQNEQSNVDSLTADKICILEQQNIEKEEQLIKCNEAYNDFKRAFESSIDSKSSLIDRYNQLVKEQNKKVFINRFTSIAALILSTAAATIIISNK